MKKFLPIVLVRLVLGLLVLTAPVGCSLYRKVFRPYRLPTPKPSPEFVAQQKASDRARRTREKAAGAGSLFRKKTDPATEEAATDVSSPTRASAPDAATPAARELPERATVRYDKQGLMKKPKLMRRRKNKPAGKPFRPWQSVRHFFKFRFHAKPNYDPDHRPAPKAPAPDAPVPDGKNTSPDGKQ